MLCPAEKSAALGFRCNVVVRISVFGMDVFGTFESDILEFMTDLADDDLLTKEARMSIRIVHWFTLCLGGVVKREVVGRCLDWEVGTHPI
jgi:hypothetical protein